MWRFRLRTLLIAVAGICLVLGPIASLQHGARTQRRNVARLEAAGAFIHYDYQLVNFRGRIGCDGEAQPPDDLFVRCLGVQGTCRVAGVWCPKWRDENGAVTSEFADADMRLLEPFTSLRWILVSSGKITDDGTEVLARFANLEDLGLGSHYVTDRTVERLVLHNTKLTALSLGGTAITDRSVEMLASLPELKVLNLSDTAVTGGCIESICHLHGLVELNLTRTSIGKGRLGALRCLRRLETVDATDTGVSEQDVLELTADRPNLTVYR